jgi:hypothetical protein
MFNNLFDVDNPLDSEDDLNPELLTALEDSV